MRVGGRVSLRAHLRTKRTNSMCGIFAVIGTFSDEEADRLGKIGSELQRHRGPDKSATEVVDLPNGLRVLLGHQRLSIIDLSEGGTQPMTSKSGDSMIIFNGEVYNYLELQAQFSLKTKSSSDTEVLLELAEKTSLEDTLRLANGMWALVMVSKQNGQILIARDRAGKKPLYIANLGNRLVVASELKTVAALSGRRFFVNAQVAADYIRQGVQDVGQASWLEGIETLGAGTIAEITCQQQSLSVTTTWRWEPELTSRKIGLAEAGEQLQDLFSNSVALRMRSDVPIGVTLSGGLDSSLIAAEMSKAFGDPSRVNAISAISPGEEGDESVHVERACKSLGITSHKVNLSWNPQDSFALMERVTWHNDAPLGSFSNVAFFRLMELARAEGIKVVLSGQGADEMFCGYRKYFFWAMREQLRSGRIDHAAANLIGSLISRTVVAQINLAEAGRYLPGSRSDNDVLTERVRMASVRHQIGIGGLLVRERQLLDLKHYSVPYLTHYEDRISMAHGVEVRLPYLDYRIIEFGLGLPLDFKVRNGWTKYLMRRALGSNLPDSIVWRRDKQGFTNPQDQWMRGPLRATIDEVFRSDALMYRHDLIEKAALLRSWERYLGGGANIWHRDIFAAWALEIWLNSFKDFLVEV